jgi:anti-sigma regulatory factor (Ser/Thr protein kinase)
MAREREAQNIPVTTMSDPVCVRLPRDPHCGAIARRILEAHTSDRLSAVALGDAKTVVAELANNAYIHGAGAIELRMTFLEDRIRLEVIDEGSNTGVRVRDSIDPASGGNGLRLVESLALRWGAYEGTTNVWAEIRL